MGCPRVVVGEAAQMASVRALLVGIVISEVESTGAYRTLETLLLLL